jgi:ketosteroid isomerase-like protein
MGLGRWSAMLVLLGSVAACVWLQAQTSGSPAKKTAKSANADSGLQATLEKLERAGWEAFKNKDKKAYQALVNDDYTAGFEDGQGEHDLKGALDSMGQVTVNSYTLSDFKLRSMSPDAAMLTYNAQVNLTMGGGKPEDMKLYVSDVWVKRAGQWKSLHYQETQRK